ncbi:MAG: DUF262 domain-containing protein [Methanobacteriaceae archaeon]|jgi:uncharacterized protein with ParB-like and HNH nuclease domain|nr:DUF262 domain-containing protein [Candidatus Methanorudis spinitermitis]
MTTNLKNKIEANDTNMNDLLKGQKFLIDYFQREYRWENKQMAQLIEDLTYTFLKDYKDGDEPYEVENYQNYYLGPIVLSQIEGKLSIIDGQQRITSITLLLIFLNHLQNEAERKVNISELIFSEKFGEKSFNLSDEIREDCLNDLFKKGLYIIKDNDDETVKNMVNRYQDIHDSFPEEINNKILPFFIDWLIYKVVIVKITAHSDENAYTIFETMNDRGLNLTPTEMLKGYVLSKIKDKEKRLKLNNLWKKQIQLLNEYKKNEDLPFFQAWFRGKYAESIREGKAGAEDKDYELVGSRLHQWFKDNHENIFNLKSPDDFFNFFNDRFPFFVKTYLMIKDKMVNFDSNMPHLNYINKWGIAESLQDPLLLASLIYTDDKETVMRKIDLVARYIETFTVRRSVNFKRFPHASIKYTMFKKRTLLIRDNDLEELSKNLKNEINNMDEKWEGMNSFRLHGQNKSFVKHLLSRVSSYVDNLIGRDTNYMSYYRPKGKQFEIEHIWANKFEDHRDEFNQMSDFEEWRNYIGALLLVPSGFNQSLGSDNYEIKLKHYLKQNAYAQSLNEEFYKKNPNEKNLIDKFKFKPHNHFKKEDIIDRQNLLKRICKDLWSIDYFDK